jgi:hypothetical protein
MPITALCLIQRAAPAGPLPAGARIEQLDDAWLVHTGQNFALPPEELSQALRALLGDAPLDQHGDARGLFFIPDVAKPSARSYAGVLEEIGDGGVWAPLRVSPPPAAAGLAGLLGGMLGQLPPDFLAAAAASARDNPQAIQQAGAQLQDLMRDPHQLAELAGSQLPGLTEMLRESGIDFGSPDLQRMAAGLQAELARDPNQLAKIAEQLFGSAADGEDEDEEDDD